MKHNCACLPTAPGPQLPLGPAARWRARRWGPNMRLRNVRRRRRSNPLLSRPQLRMCAAQTPGLIIVIGARAL